MSIESLPNIWKVNKNSVILSWLVRIDWRIAHWLGPATFKMDLRPQVKVTKIESCCLSYRPI